MCVCVCAACSTVWGTSPQSAMRSFSHRTPRASSDVCCRQCSHQGCLCSLVSSMAGWITVSCGARMLARWLSQFCVSLLKTRKTKAEVDTFAALLPTPPHQLCLGLNDTFAKCSPSEMKRQQHQEGPKILIKKLLLDQNSHKKQVLHCWLFYQ